MKKLLFILFIAIYAVVGCKKETTINEKYAPGNLSIGINNDAKLRSIFDTLNLLDLKISRMRGFYFNAYLPADSINYLKNLLVQKSYLDLGEASISYHLPGNVIQVLCSQFNMNTINQEDFLNTIMNLNLVDRKENNKTILIEVPVGSEKFWLHELKKYSFIRWVELDYYVYGF